MKTYTILGNCQSIILADALNNHKYFSEKFKYIPLPPIHTINPQKDKKLLEIFDNIDLLIFQPVVDKVRFGEFTSHSILKRLKKKSLSISIPSMYYSGYFPTIESIEQIEGTLRKVHDFAVVALFLSSKSIDDTLEFVNKTYFLDAEEIRNMNNKSINELKYREEFFNIDIKISHFIENNFKKKRLFHTFNHPTSILVKFVINEILNYLGINNEGLVVRDLLDEIKAPIYPKIYESLDLKFDNKEEVENCGKIFSIKEFVCNDFNIYSKSDKKILYIFLKKKKKFLLDKFRINY